MFVGVSTGIATAQTRIRLTSLGNFSQAIIVDLW
jgi:hypothetical protein